MTESLVDMGVRKLRASKLEVSFAEEAKEQGSRFKHVRWNIVKHDGRVVASGVADNRDAANDAAQEWMNGMRLLLG